MCLSTESTCFIVKWDKDYHQAIISTKLMKFTVLVTAGIKGGQQLAVKKGGKQFLKKSWNYNIYLK